ncbi:hypothetical protein Tsp_08485, partial [Trichinella spiralis]
FYYFHTFIYKTVLSKTKLCFYDIIHFNDERKEFQYV